MLDASVVQLQKGGRCECGTVAERWWIPMNACAILWWMQVIKEGCKYLWWCVV